jgi:glycosyltransferase 2 family protein
MDTASSSGIADRTAAPGWLERRFGGRRRDLLGLGVSVVSLVAVVWWAARQEAPRFPTAAGDIAILVGAALLYAAPTAARGVRWHEILRRAGVVHKRLDAYALVVVGYMGNTVLPARGGEVLRAVIMGPRSNARRREILGTIIAERLLDVFVLVCIFSVMTFANVGGSPLGEAPAVIAVAAVGAAVVAVSLYLRWRRRGRFERFAAIVRPFARSSKLLFGRLGIALVGLTVLVWLLEGTILMLVGKSLELDLSLLDGVFLVVLASFTAMVPAAPGYVGTFDAALIFGLKALDVAGGDAVAFAVLARFILFVPITAAGLLLCFVRYGGFSALRSYEAPA